VVFINIKEEENKRFLLKNQRTREKKPFLFPFFFFSSNQKQICVYLSPVILFLGYFLSSDGQ